MIREANAGDAAAVSEIYNHYVVHTTVTFEETAVSDVEMAGRIDDTLACGLPYLVAAPSGVVEGFAYATRWKSRAAYAHSAEVTVYVRDGRCGRGLGSALVGELVDRLGARGVHALLAGIALPNEASIAMHVKLGFEKAAHFREVGRKFGRWIDVGYWQRVLSR